MRIEEMRIIQRCVRSMEKHNSETASDPVLRGDIYGMLACLTILRHDVEYEFDIKTCKFTRFATDGNLRYEYEGS